MYKSFKKVRKRRVSKRFREFSYRFIKLKYFVMLSVAMLLEIVTLIIYMFNNEKIIEFDLMTASVLYGVTSFIVIVIAVVLLILIKTDKSRDKKVLKQFNMFKDDYLKLDKRYSYDIDDLVKSFDSERENIEKKVDYARKIEKKYDGYISEFSKIKVPPFLRDAFDYKMDSLEKEKLFFNRFSSLKNMDELGKINLQSDLANGEFLKEIDSVEKRLKIIA
ncbi:MAG: hypothetical protein U9O59_06660 [Actinomycetota bacterium]|nr:hypothetical protein [Actinomycetota bacterium]